MDVDRKRMSWGRNSLRRKRGGELERYGDEKRFDDVAGTVHIRLYAAARPVMAAGACWAVHGALAKVYAADGLILCQSSLI